jgi:hypothetical protein
MRPDAPHLRVREWMDVLDLADRWDMAPLKADAVAAIEATFADYKKARARESKRARYSHSVIDRGLPTLYKDKVDIEKASAEEDVPLSDRLALADKYDISRWALDALAELVWREELPESVELETLGMHRILKFMAARERHLQSVALNDKHLEMGCGGCDLCCGQDPLALHWVGAVQDTMDTFGICVEDHEMEWVLEKRAHLVDIDDDDDDN